MSSTTIRIRKSTRDTLRDLADEAGEPMQAVLEKAVDAYRRRSFLEAVNASYAALHEDDAASRAFRDELQLWDATLGDGLAELGDRDDLAVYARPDEAD